MSNPNILPIKIHHDGTSPGLTTSLAHNRFRRPALTSDITIHETAQNSSSRTTEVARSSSESRLKLRPNASVIESRFSAIIFDLSVVGGRSV